jgi:hypothetical protein
LDVFVHDCQTGVTERVDVSSAGQQSGGAGGAAISGNGRFVAFRSNVSDLAPNDTNGGDDLFVHDRVGGSTVRVSLGLGGQQVYPGWYAGQLSVTDDGRVIFGSGDPGFALGDSGMSNDVFLSDPALPSSAIAGYCTSKTNSQGCVPHITSIGFPSLTDSATFFVSASEMRSSQPGMLIWSVGQRAVPFGGGWLCLAVPVHRTPSRDSGGSASVNCSGSYSFHLSPGYLTSHALAPGMTVFGQFYGRDPGFAWPNNVSLTDALQFTVLP